MEEIALSDNEKELLYNAIQTERDGFKKTTLILISLFILYIFMPERYGNPSLYLEHGFLKPALVMILLAMGFSYYHNRIKLDALNEDLGCEKKIRVAKIVWKKEKSLMPAKYRIRLRSDYKDFKTFDIDKEDYNKIENGHIVFLEYGKKSKILFKIDLNIK